MLSSSEESKEDIKEENIEEKMNEEITEQSVLVEVTEKENKESATKEKGFQNHVKTEVNAKDSVVIDVVSLIEKPNFSEMINIFSDSLFC